MTDAVNAFSPFGSNTQRPLSRTLALAVMLVAVVFGAFANTLLNGFVFDDISVIIENPAIRDAIHVTTYFTRPFFSVGQPTRGPVAYDYYRPLVLLSHLGEYLAWGPSPWGYHLTNIFLHAGVTVLVFLLLIRLGLGDAPAFIGAALFAVHPALADSVASISGRSDPLCAIFFLGSVHCYLSARREHALVGVPLLICSYASFVLALLSKENAVVLPVILTLYEVIRPEGAARTKMSAAVRRLLPVYLLVAFYFVWRFSVVPHSASLPADKMELVRRLLTAARAAMSYAYIMVFPHNLGFETFISTSTPSAVLEGMCAALFLILALALAVMILRISRRASFFILWFLVCLLPFSYFFLFHPEPDFFTPPHFLYFPSMGIVALWGLGIANTTRAIPPITGAWRKRALILSQAVIIFFFSVSTVRRNTTWRDEFTFFSAMAQYAPESPRIHIGMANVLLNAGQPGPALAEYGRAYELARKPEEAPIVPTEAGFEGTTAARTDRIIISNYYAGAALAGMGNAHLMMGETLQAIENYEKAAHENAFDATIHLRLARAYELAGRFDDAIESYERALRLDKNLSDAAASLRVAQTKKNVYDQAKDVYQSAHMSGQQGSAEALYGEAVMLRLSGREEAAAALLRQALEKAPADFGANLALGQILSGRGDYGAAFGYYSVAFAARPDSALAARELALTSLALNDTLTAELWAAKAYELEPDEFYERFLGEVKRKARR